MTSSKQHYQSKVAKLFWFHPLSRNHCCGPDIEKRLDFSIIVECSLPKRRL